MSFFALRNLFVILLGLILLSGCQEEPIPENTEPVIRGLKGYLVTESANTEIRRYPSVVQPAQESKLSFEVGGKLRAVQLEVGQKVEFGDVLAEIDPSSLELKVQQSSASLDEALAQQRNSQLDYDRKKQLLEKNYVTQSEYDIASNQLVTSIAQADQAKRQLELAREDLSKSKLISPFQGLISSIDAQDFSQISAGEIVLGLYSDGAYEVSFSVPAAIINKLNLGDTAVITFADIAGQNYVGRIKELGSRAGQVSAFPVVVALDNPPDSLRAGMAANVELRVKIGAGSDGMLVPLSSFYFGGSKYAVTDSQRHADFQRANTGTVFVYDPSTSTVKTRQIEFQGISENMAIVHDGISEGEIVAAAGVSYLRDGQRVNLLPFDN